MTTDDDVRTAFARQDRKGKAAGPLITELKRLQEFDAWLDQHDAELLERTAADVRDYIMGVVIGDDVPLPPDIAEALSLMQTRAADFRRGVHRG